MVPVCMWHSVQTQCFICMFAGTLHTVPPPWGWGIAQRVGLPVTIYTTGVQVSHRNCSANLPQTEQFLWWWGRGNLGPLTPVEPTPREGTWWNTFAGTIFHSQVCWPQLPLSQTCCNLFLKAARDALEDIWSKLSHTLLLHVNARLMLDCKIFVDITEIIYNRWQVPCHNVQVLRR